MTRDPGVTPPMINGGPSVVSAFIQSSYNRRPSAPQFSRSGASVTSKRVPVLATVLVFVLAATTRAPAQNITSIGTLRLQTDAPARNTAVVEPFLVGGWAL